MVEKINQFLLTLREKKLYRKEEVFDKYVRHPNILFSSSSKKKLRLTSFASNNYLGLAENKKVIQAGVAALKCYGTSSCSSKFIEGYYSLYEEIKFLINSIKVAEDTLLFNSGYLTNLGVFPSIATKEDIVFLDENSHASTFEGVKLCGAKHIRYKHNDVVDLESKIDKYAKGKNIIIATETIFSMKGSVLNHHNKYIEVANKYNAILVTDEAHSFGVIDFDFSPYKLHLRVGTFSKAVAALGGYVSGNSLLIDKIRNSAKSGIYTTSLPPSVLATIVASLKLIKNGLNGKKAIANAKYFFDLIKQDTKFKNITFYNSQIIFIENENADLLSSKLQDYGFFIKDVKKPTVEKAGLRFSFNNLHKKVDIEKLAFILTQVF